MGVLVAAEPDNACKEFGERNIPKLPKELWGDFYKVKYKGKTYIIIVGIHKECDFPVELFCFEPSLETIETFVDFKKIPDHRGVRKKVKRGMYMFESEYIKIPDLSLYNSVDEKQLAVNISALMRQGMPKKYIIETIKKVDNNIASFTSVCARILAKYIPATEDKSELCPECGLPLINENGCKHCTCGYSACS